MVQSPYKSVNPQPQATFLDGFGVLLCCQVASKDSFAHNSQCLDAHQCRLNVLWDS